MFKAIQRFFKPNAVASKKRSYSGRGFLGFPHSDGVVVSPLRSLGFSAVFACVKAITDDLSTLPTAVYVREQSGHSKDYTHDQYNLISKKPSPLYNAIEYKRTLIANFLLWGNGYAKIHRGSNGRPTRYEILEPWKVEPFIFKSQSVGKVKLYKNYETGEIIDSDDMIHLADLSFDGVKGMSRISIARQGIALALNAEEFGNDYYKRGAFMSGYLTIAGNLSKGARESLQESFINSYAGRENAGTIGVLEEGLDFKPYEYAMPMADAEFLDSRKFQVVDVARFFNMPPHKIGHLDKSSFNNIEQQNDEYVINTLMPIAKLFEIEHDNKVFQDASKNFVKIELKGLLRGDIKARTEFYTKLIDRGVFSLNEVRQLEDMKSFDGGDIRILPLNYVSVDEFEGFDRSGLKIESKKEKD